MRAAGFSATGYYKNAILFLGRAFSYDRTLAGFASVFKDAVKVCIGQAMRYLVPKRS